MENVKNSFYVPPKLEVIPCQSQDIITTSAGGEGYAPGYGGFLPDINVDGDW